MARMSWTKRVANLKRRHENIWSLRIGREFKIREDENTCWYGIVDSVKIRIIELNNKAIAVAKVNMLMPNGKIEKFEV